VPAETSVASWIASLPASARAAELDRLAPTIEARAALRYDWLFWGRPSQQPPAGVWTKWLINAGRGFGKTRTGAEWIVRQVRDHIEGAADFELRLALVGQTPADVRDVMVEGESGILAVCPPWLQPEWNRTTTELIWRGPDGRVVARAKGYSGHNPGKLRGPQHHIAWADELAAWKYPETWDQLMFGLRLTDRAPQVVITTTPKPVRTVRELLKDPACRVTRGSTHDNAENLAEAFFEEIITKYEGTTLGLQEIYAQLLDEAPGALWKRSNILRGDAPADCRIVVAIDPATSKTSTSDETGIIVAGWSALTGRSYVLEDLSGIYSPKEWAQVAVDAYHAWGAVRIVAEKNQGGDMVEEIVRMIDPSISYRGVHAKDGKFTRAEPIAALYEQHKVYHVDGFADLEDQMCTWSADLDWSPDRLDALVYALTELALRPTSVTVGNRKQRAYSQGEGYDDGVVRVKGKQFADQKPRKRRS
jgi:phage terminase large subunit-like protein